MAEVVTRYELRNRYLFEGQLVMQTALHIGGGKASLSRSDSPVVLTPTGHPFIPGSSFKGALRSTVEKLVPQLPQLPDGAKLSSCALIELPAEDQALETRSESKHKSCPTARQKGIRDRRRELEQKGKEYDLEEYEFPYLCNTCGLFGSPFSAARANVNDLYLSSEQWEGGIQVRDGVVIDRDSETAKDGLKYDFEVVPASATFKLRIQLENATDQDLQLICVGLSEFVQGFGMIGGKRSRGLGACTLEELTVSSLELVSKDSDGKDIKHYERLQNYLVDGTFSTLKEPGQEFLSRHINSIFKKG